MDIIRFMFLKTKVSYMANKLIQFKVILLIFISLTICYKSSAGGPWVSEKGKGYAHLSYTGLSYDRGINANIFKKIEDITIQPYFQLGLGHNLGIEITAPFKRINSSGPVGLDVSNSLTHVENGNLNAFGNVNLTLKKMLKDSPFPMGYGLNISTPSRNTISSQLYTGYDAWGINPFISIGRGTSTGYSYATLGYKWLSNGYSDLIQFEIETSGKIEMGNTKLYIGGAINSSIPTNEYKTTGTRSEQTLLYTNGAGYISPGIKILIQLPNKLEITASGFGAFWGKFVAAVPAASLGLGYKW